MSIAPSRSVRSAIGFLAIATVSVLTACGGGGSDTPSGTQGDFTFSISPSSVTIEQGQSQVVTASLTRTGGFAGAVSGTVDGLPAGVTLTPLTISESSSSATVTVSVSATAVPGTYPIVIRAQASGVAAKQATVQLTITAPPVPAFATTVTPSVLSIEQGDSATVTVAVTRSGGFAGALSGVVSGLPDGVTTSALAIGASATSGTLTIRVDGATAPSVPSLATADASAPGTYSLVLTTSGVGVDSQADTIALTVTAPPVPDITVGLAPDSLTITPGAQATSTLAITRGGGFSGDVTVALQGTAPAGLTVTTPSAPVSGSSATVSVAVSAQAAPGTYPLTIAASGSGVPTRTAVLTVVVPDLGSFSLAAQPTNVTVTQGDSTVVTVTVTRVAPFVAPVTLSVTGLPTGVTASVSPNPVTGGTATIILRAAGDAALGGATVSVAGTGGGVSSAPLSLPVMVNASGGGGAGNVTYTFCATEGLPQFVAYQDGTGPWMRATAGPADSYSFNINSGRGGVAVVTDGAFGASTAVEYGTATELNLFGDQGCTTETAGRSYTGTVAGIGPAERVQIVAGGAVGLVQPFATTYSLQNVSNDPFDLLASSFALNGAAAGRIIIRRGIDAPSGSQLPVLDFASQEAFFPEARPVTIANSLGEETSVFALYVLTGGAAGGLFYQEVLPSTATNRTWYGIPSARQAAGDLHVVGVTASTDAADLDDARSRSVVTVTRDLQAINVTLPAPVSTPQFTTTTGGGNIQAAGAYTVQPDYGSNWSLSFVQPGLNTVDATVTVTSGYANGATVVNLVVPNLSALPGYDTMWGLKSGVGYRWDFTASGWAGGFGLTPGGFGDGAISRTGTLSGSAPAAR